MKRCAKCVMPETQDKLTFNENGVCSLCATGKRKEEIDWGSREKELRKILEKFRSKSQYDCLIPYSGGKDSSFQAYTMVKKFNMKPLLYTFHHTFLSRTGLYNMFNTVQKLGVEHLLYTPNKKLVSKLMRLSLRENGDWCWYCHSGIYGNTMQAAVRHQIPLIIWGESVAEYKDDYTLDDFEQIDYYNFFHNKQAGIGWERFVGGEEITEKDLAPFKFPSTEEIEKLKPISMHLGSYIKWDIAKQVELIKRELGWKDASVEGTYCTYDKQECRFIGIRDYCKYLKRGFGRTTHQASLDIRAGQISREEGLKLAEQYDGKRPASLDSFLEEIELSEKEYMEILAEHCIPPWNPVEFKDRPETGPHIDNTDNPLEFSK